MKSAAPLYEFETFHADGGGTEGRFLETKLCRALATRMAEQMQGYNPDDHSDTQRWVEDLLTLHPDFMEAGLILAEMVHYADPDSMCWSLRALAIVKKTLKHAKAHMPKGYRGRLPWGFLDNRPYLSLLWLQFMLQQQVLDHAAAIKTAKTILRLNPDDNQGVRYALPYLCLGAFQYMEAREALQRLDDEDGLIVSATRAIYAHTQGDKVTFRRELAKALFTLPVLRMVFLGSNKTMPTDESGYRGLQPDMESFMWYSKLTLERTQGLRKAIKDFLSEPKVIQAEVELRKHWNATRGDRSNPTTPRKIPMENWDQLLVKWIERVAA